MKIFLTMGFCTMLGLSLIAGCGGGSAIQSFTTPPPRTTPSSCPSGGCFSLLATPPPQNGNLGQFFQLALIDWVQGGVSPYTMTIGSGTLPAGLTLTSQGVVLGIPTATTVATAIDFTVTDSESPPVSVHVPISLTINPMLPLTISPASGALPGGRVGNLYHQRCVFGHCWSGFLISGSGGMQGSFIQPYIFRWSATPGSSLVPGLSMTSRGLISGTPTTAGLYSFIVTVTDFELPPNNVSANYTITVAP